MTVAPWIIHDYFAPMRRLRFARVLLTLLATASVASDTAAKVLHGVTHLEEGRAAQLSPARVAAPSAEGAEEVANAFPVVEVHETDADHSALHAVSVAPRLVSVIAMPGYVTGSPPAAVVTAIAATPPSLTNRARPPNPGRRPAQPRAPPIG